MQTTEVVEEVKALLEEAGHNHGKVYIAICHGMRHIDPSPSGLSEKLGRSAPWATQYRYMVELTNLAFSALHEQVISRGAARLLAQLVDRDQDECVRVILDQNMKLRRAEEFVQEKINQPGRIKRVTKPIRHEWPEKEIVPLRSEETPSQPAPPPAPANVPVPGEGTNGPSKLELRRRWTDDTGELREHGVMPPEIMDALFGDEMDNEIRQALRSGDGSAKESQSRPQTRIVVHTPVPPVAKVGANGSDKSDQVTTERVFLPHVVGNELIVAGIVWILIQVLKLLMKLNSVPAPKLAAAMLDPVDERRLISLARQIGDQIALAEELLLVAAKHRGK